MDRLGILLNSQPAVQVLAVAYGIAVH